ncbi:YraN family protein [Butyricimonas faecihominis]|uniref:YraN family protein n=1 Tax=Butyricimonas faecihominis TaxID=1472416 RepID=UPI0026707E30|nr:YraN family protein [Butyricimonas faecihominis]
MIDLYNIAKLFLGCKLGGDCTMAWHNKLGEFGEEKVNRYLLDMGYMVLERNWRVGHRELDFVCLDGEVLVVVEVKTRADDNVSLFDLLDYRKKRNLQAAGAAYLTKKNIHREIRFDLVVVTGAEMHLEHIKEVIDLF